MSRHPRAVLADVPMHIVQRGNNRMACFFDTNDYRTYLSLLEDALKESACVLHAYVLMPNHVHLLASPTAAGSPAGLMKRAGQGYVQYVNRKYGRVGTLWQGRYHSSLVESERYLLTCQRYIELNPVRAGMVARPSDFPWSSYHVNADGEPSTLITPHAVYNSIHPDKQARQSSYRDLFAQALNSSQLELLRNALKNNGICGSAEFADTMGSTLGRNFSRRRREAN
jgi:putative transposase